MSRPTQFGRIHPPDQPWLAKRPPEPILEPDLPVIALTGTVDLAGRV